MQAAADGDWSRPAPCENWTARDVVVHVANNMLNLAAGLSGSEPQPMADDEDTVAGWSRALEAARTVVVERGDDLSHVERRVTDVDEAHGVGHGGESRADPPGRGPRALWPGEYRGTHE